MDTTDYGWLSKPTFLVIVMVAIAICVQVYISQDYSVERTSRQHDELTPGFTDRVVEFFGIQRSDLMTPVSYIALLLLTLCFMMFMSLVYVFLKETMYYRWFGHTLTAENKVLMEMNVRLEEVLIEMNVRLEEMCKCLHENSTLKILEELKSFRTETSTAIETITNSPARLTNGATP